MSPGSGEDASEGLDPEAPDEEERRARMAEAVRQVVTRRERAPRSPRLERALKRLIWRYTQEQDRPPDS